MPKPSVASWPSNVSVLIACVALLGFGCSDDGHRLGGVAYRIVDGVKVGACRDGADIEPIDFLEDGDATIELTEGRAGVWFSFHDETVGTQWPATDAEVFDVTKLRPARSESRFAARTHGSGFSKWGAGIGFELKSQKPYDLSRYAGVTFWARRGEGELAPVRFAVTDPQNAPRGKVCNKKTENPPCDNFFGVDLYLDTEFRGFSFTWDELAHDPRWGEFDPNLRFDPSAAYGIRFQTWLEMDGEVPRTTEFDFTIDDVALTCPRP
jgi:hypothetical protein